MTRLVLWESSVRWSVTKEAKEVAYKTLVQPQIEYGACITDLHTQQLIIKLERVQCQAVRWVAGNYQRMASVTEMQTKLGWETLEVRRSKIRIAMFYKILNNLVAIKTTQLLITTNATRKNHALTILQLQARPSYYHYSIYPWTIPLCTYVLK